MSDMDEDTVVESITDASNTNNRSNASVNVGNDGNKGVNDPKNWQVLRLDPTPFSFEKFFRWDRCPPEEPFKTFSRWDRCPAGGVSAASPAPVPVPTKVYTPMRRVEHKGRVDYRSVARNKCAYCKKTFESRNQLFWHLRMEGVDTNPSFDLTTISIGFTGSKTREQKRASERRRRYRRRLDSLISRLDGLKITSSTTAVPIPATATDRKRKRDDEELFESVEMAVDRGMAAKKARLDELNLPNVFTTTI